MIATRISTVDGVGAVEPSDAQLLRTLGSLLAAVPGPFVGPRLSTLVAYVCTTCCENDGDGRAQRLELELAEFLNARRVLRTGQVSPAGLDEWAAAAPIVFVRAAVVACARCQSGGAR